jgi:hypothetical protein
MQLTNRDPLWGPNRLPPRMADEDFHYYLGILSGRLKRRIYHASSRSFEYARVLGFLHRTYLQLVQGSTWFGRQNVES